MNLTRAKSRSGILSLRLATALLACALIPLLAFAAAPGWWSQRGVITPNASPDDYALANQGQLKNIAKAAVGEFDAHLPGGAGNPLHNLVNSWSQSNAQRNDYAPVNLGQLKNVAKPFYDRLITIRYVDNYPWIGALNPPDDFAIANIGQIKNLFTFDLLATDIAHDSDQNGLPDWWEKYYFGHIGIDPSAAAARGDGLTNLQAFQQQLNPIDYYDGQPPVVTIVSGDNQQSAPNDFAPLPLVIKISDAQSQTLANAPITFTVTEGGGLLATSTAGPTSSVVAARTVADGTASVFYLQPAIIGTTSRISAAAGTGSSQATAVFTATAGAMQTLSVIPGSFDEIVNAGQTVTRTATLRNNSNATRQFTAQLENSYNVNISYSDSDQSGGPQFVWNDISATGTHLDSVSDADDDFEAVDISFPFPYFGDTYSKIYVGSNGFVTLGAGSSSYHNQRLPSTSAPANLIAAFHNDLDLGSSGDVYYQDNGDSLVVQFTNAARYDGDGLATFQIVLQRDGTILFYYKDMIGTVNEATVGIQNSTRNNGLTIAYQESYLKNDLAVRISVSVERFTSSVDNGAWSDSDQVGGPEFVWNDISVTGTHLNNVSNSDDGFEAFNIGFSFPYFGNSYATVYVSANGYVTLGAPSNDYSTYSFPDPSAPANDIAAFQNDLNLGVSGDVYYQDFGDRAVIQFNNAARYAGDGFATFQIVLNSDGTVLFYYKEMTGNVSSASVGVQNADGTKGITIANQQAYLKNNLAVRILTTSLWLEVSPAAGSLAPGQSADLALTLNARDLTSGLFHGRVNITTDDPADPAVLVPVTMTVNPGPSISLSLTNHGPTFVEGDSVTVAAVATDPYGVSIVEFYEGGVKLGESSVAGFVFAWQNAPAGIHLISARAVDNRGAAGRSQPLTVDIQLDSNHNGMGDAWEMEHFGNLNQTAEGDFDHDGWNNLAEFRAGTDPTHFDDADGDGVGDGEEINVYHTNPNLADSDGDGMPDGYEIANFLDPLHNDSQADPDGDGLTNFQEMTLGTDPQKWDTDDDGVSDGDDGWPNDPDLHPPRLPEYNYAVIDLGEGRAVAINNSNQVVVGFVPAGQKGFLWDHGTRTDLPIDTTPVAMNEAGTVLLQGSNDGVWSNGAVTPLTFTSDPSGKIFGVDPNITWANGFDYAHNRLTRGRGISINNAGHVVGRHAIDASWRFDYDFLGWHNGEVAALWAGSYEQPVFLKKIPDGNDRMLTPDNSGYLGFIKDWEGNIHSSDFFGSYDNRLGLDDLVEPSAINNSDQVVGNCWNFESVASYAHGFFSRDFFAFYESVVLWSNQEPELVAQGANVYANDINDDGIILGSRGAGASEQGVLWVKVAGEWKEKMLEHVGYRLNRNLQVINGRYLTQNAHLVDLNTRIPAGYTITYGTDINEAGIIVGQANTPSGVGHAVLLVPVEIKEVISDQISGNEANKLPTGKAYVGDDNNPMLMASQTGVKTDIAVRIDVPNAFASKMLVGVKKTNASIITKAVPPMLAPEKTLIEFDAEGFHASGSSDQSNLYEVVAGYDGNGNGTLEPSEVSVVFDKTPGVDSSPPHDKFRVITQDFYESSANYLEIGAVLTPSGIAGDLLNFFATGTPVPEATVSDFILTSTSYGLTHPLGAKWDNTNSAVAHLLTFAQTTGVSGLVANSNFVYQLLESTVQQRKAEIATYFVTHPGESAHDFPFPYSGSKDFNDTDPNIIVNVLGNAFGKVTISGSLVAHCTLVGLPEGRRFLVTQIDYTGGFEDLYDFKYGGSSSFSPPLNGACVQAGYASLSTLARPSGRVFKSNVNFEKSRTNWNTIYDGSGQ